MGKVMVTISTMDKKILLLKADGMPSKQICDIVNMTEDAVNKRLIRLRDRFNCVSILHLYKTMKDLGYI